MIMISMSFFPEIARICFRAYQIQANGLVINLQKTHYMMFHRARIKTNSSKINIRDNEISRVFSTIFLGIIIDDQLKWLEHIQYIKNKVSKSVGILSKVQKYLDQQTLHNLYYTFVYPYLIYGVEIWGNACNVYLDPLVTLQKKCLRIITFSSYLEHTEPLFQNLEILNFKQLVIHRIAMLMFKNSKEMVPIEAYVCCSLEMISIIITTLDRVDHFIPQLERVKRYTGLFHFMV